MTPQKVRAFVLILTALSAGVPPGRAEAQATKAAKQYPISDVKEPVAAALKRLSLWPEVMVGGFLMIDPDRVYELNRLDEKTRKPNGTEKVKGSQIRDSISLIVGFNSRASLDAVGKEALNLALHDNIKDEGDDKALSALRVARLKRALEILGEYSSAK